MDFVRGLYNLRYKKRPCAVAIGNFDGVHLGHQSVLKQLKDCVRDSELLATVLIFEPQPAEFFYSQKAPARLMRLREKLWQFEKHDIDCVVCLKFDQSLADLSAEDFVRNILFEGLDTRKLIIGDDFRFAKNREGDYRYLLKAGKRYGFEVCVTVPFNIDNERVSSTRIRQALTAGDMCSVGRMSGRPYRISGRVIHGNKRGRRLGFATVNVGLHRHVSPVSGVFSSHVIGVNDTPLDAVAYIGSKSVSQGRPPVLEAHIFDFDEDLYGRYIQVELLEKLRDDSHFDTEQQLIDQIKADIRRARESLKANI